MYLAKVAHSHHMVLLLLLLLCLTVSMSVNRVSLSVGGVSATVDWELETNVSLLGYIHTSGGFYVCDQLGAGKLSYTS